MNLEEAKALKRMKDQRDLLATALRDTLAEIGVCKSDVEPNGPELLMLAENYIEHPFELTPIMWCHLCRESRQSPGSESCWVCGNKLTFKPKGF